MFRRLKILAPMIPAVLMFAIASAVGAGKPNLAVAIFPNPPDARPVAAPGQETKFTVAINNMRGTADAHEVTLLVSLPNGLKLKESVPPPKVDTSGKVSWEIGAMAAGALPQLFEVTAVSDPALRPGTQLHISAEVRGRERDAGPDDNRADYRIFMQDAAPALVFLGSTLDSTPLTPDAPATFQIDLRNAGTLAASAARLGITIPPEMKLDSSDPSARGSGGGRIDIGLGDIQPGQDRTVKVTIDFDPRQVPALLNTGRALPFNFELFCAAAQGEMLESRRQTVKKLEFLGADLAIWLTPLDSTNPGEVSPGAETAYANNYGNLGNKAAHKVVVSLALGPGLAIANVEPKPARTHVPVKKPFTWQPTKVVSDVTAWEFAQIDPGLSGSIMVHIRSDSLPADGSLLTTTITAGDADLDASNNSASLFLHRGSLPPAKAVVRTVSGEKVSRTSHRWRHIFLFAMICVLGIWIWRGYMSRRA